MYRRFPILLLATYAFVHCQLTNGNNRRPIETPLVPLTQTGPVLEESNIRTTLQERCIRIQDESTNMRNISGNEGERVIGCTLYDGEKLPLGKMCETDSAVYKCERDNEGFVLRPISCKLGGRKMKIGETYATDSYYYKCNQKPSGGIGIHILGCADPQGFLIQFGQKFQNGKFVYQCHRGDHEVTIIGVQCVGKSGRIYSIGETWHQDHYYYKCQRDGQTSIRISSIACADSRGNKVGSGETVVHGRVAYKCNKIGKTFTHIPIGCYVKEQSVDQHKIYYFGESWYESYGRFGFSFECEATEKGVRRVAYRCFYKDSTRDIFAPRNCLVVVDERALICMTLQNNQLMSRITRIPEGNTADEYAQSLGIERCEPRSQLPLQPQISEPSESVETKAPEVPPPDVQSSLPEHDNSILAASDVGRSIPSRNESSNEKTTK